MRRRLRKLDKYLDLRLTEEQRVALEIADEYTIQYIDEIIKLAQMNYFVPKLMNYYTFYIDDESSTVTFKSSGIKVTYPKNKVMENPARVAKELQALRNKSYMRDFIKESKQVITELLENVIELNTIEIEVTDNNVVISQSNFIDLIDKLPHPIFLQIKG